MLTIVMVIWTRGTTVELTILKDAEFPAARFHGLVEILTGNPRTSRVTVLGYQSYDPRTNIGPYYGISQNMPSLGLGMIVELSHRVGMTALMVNGAWNPNVRLDQAQVAGKKPDAVLFSQMSIHYADLEEKIRQLEGVKDRPLALVGGHLANYEPWRALMAGGDIAVSGEAPTYFQFMERLLTNWTPGQSMRDVALDMANKFKFNDIQGISYLWRHPSTGQDFLFSTGRAQLPLKLDEMNDRLASLSLLEPPHKHEKNVGHPMPLEDLHKHVMVVSLQASQGCPEDCDFCPLPEYNHRKHRSVSPEKITQQVVEVYKATEIKRFFLTDDNIGMSAKYLEGVVRMLAEARVDGKSLRELGVLVGSEITMKALANNLHLFQLMQQSALREFWVGQESFNVPDYADKGQTPERVAAVHAASAKYDVGIHWMTIKTDETPFTTRQRLPGDDYARRMLMESDQAGKEKQNTLEAIVDTGPQNDASRIFALAGEHRELRTKRDVSFPRWSQIYRQLGDGLVIIGEEDTQLSLEQRAAQIKAKANYLLLKQQSEDKENLKMQAYIKKIFAEAPEAQKALDAINSLRGENGKFGDLEEIELAMMLGGKYGGKGIQRLALTISTASNFWLLPYANNSVLSRVGDQAIGPHYFDGNRVVVVAQGHPNPAQIQNDIMTSLERFYNDERLAFLREKAATDPVAKEYLADFVIGRFQLQRSKTAMLEHQKALESGNVARNAPMPNSPWPIISLGTPQYPFDGSQLYKAKVGGIEAKLFVYPDQTLLSSRTMTARTA